MPTIKWISTSQQLEKLCQSWLQQDFIALDTEFVRERTYYPQPGLVQVGCSEGIWLLDPLKITDWSCFAKVLQARQTVKVVHACGEDLEVFHLLCGALPQPLFDSQLAAAYAGLGFSWSYARLVEHFLQLKLDKEQTRSNWLQRPLSAQQQEYAAQDVIHLARLYPQLRSLLSVEKLGWLFEDGDTLVQQQQQQTDFARLWQGFKQAWRLDARQAAALQALASWREQQARQRDLPRNRVLHESQLLELAQQLPGSIEELEQTQLGHGSRRRYGQTLLELINAALEQPEQSWPQPLPPPLSIEQNRLIKLLRRPLAAFATQHQMSSELLVRKKVLQDLILTRDANNLYHLPDSLHGWRREQLGHLLLQELNHQEKQA